MRNAILIRLGGLFEITGSPPVYNVGDTIAYTFGTAGGTGPITWACTSLGSSGASFSAGSLSVAINPAPDTGLMSDTVTGL